MSVIRHVMVHGRVQGVGFRAFVEVEALRRGVQGWVRNRRDGSVEMVLSGEAAMIEEMIEVSWQGPMGARVDALHQREGEAADLKPLRPGELFSVLATV
jgi:acylphosphatase